jgi:N-acetylneuraminic acid mutarotase
VNNFYSCYLQYTFYRVAKFSLTVLLLTVIYLTAAGQEFNTITWGTAKIQPTPTHEVHGEVVGGKLYIFGGYDYTKRPDYYSPTKRSYVYDPVANTWSPIADLPHRPNGEGFGGITHEGLTNDGTNIYFAGGYTSNSTGTGQLFGTKQVWRYNVASDSYDTLPDLPEELAAGQLRYLNGKIHYFGGANLSRKDVGVHYALDLNNASAGWVALAPLLNPVNHPGSAVYGGKIYLIGGSHGQDNSTVTQQTVEVYDPNTDTWTRVANMPVARDHISSSVVVLGDRIIVLGGETSHNILSDLVSAYSPATDTWTELTPLPAGKSAGIAAVLENNLYYTGGNFSRINYKGVPQGEVVLSSQPTPAVNAIDSVRAAISLKKPLVYPNPLAGKFNIRFPFSYTGNFSFIITNQNGINYNLGKVRVERGGSSVSFDISNLSLPPGVYFLKINSNVKSEELKLIIK